MKRWSQAILISSVLIAPAACAQQAVSQGPKITGMYSDMSYNREGGDIIGMEVFLVYSREGYRVVYQSSEGETTSPIVIPAHVEGNSIRFSLPSGTDPHGDFTGRIEPTEMTGTFSGNGQTVHLPRRNSYWQ